MLGNSTTVVINILSYSVIPPALILEVRISQNILASLSIFRPCWLIGQTHCPSLPLHWSSLSELTQWKTPPSFTGKQVLDCTESSSQGFFAENVHGTRCLCFLEQEALYSPLRCWTFQLPLKAEDTLCSYWELGSSVPSCWCTTKLGNTEVQFREHPCILTPGLLFPSSTTT